MIYVGIDVAKDKHDCCILGNDGDKIYPVFTISNNRVGFNELFSRIEDVTTNKAEIKVGLEATGHYSNNLLDALVDKVFPTFVINPPHTNLYRKGQSLNCTKTKATHSKAIIGPYASTGFGLPSSSSLT